MKSKGPDDNQVNAIAGFGHQIMRESYFLNHKRQIINGGFLTIFFPELVDEIEKEKKEEEDKNKA